MGSEIRISSRFWGRLCPFGVVRDSVHVRQCDTQLPSIFRWFDVQLYLHVVDPDPLYLDALQQILRSSVSLCIIRFDSGEQYAEYLRTQRIRRQRIHAVLISFHLDRSDTPTMTGLELLECTTRYAPRITPIMLAQGDEFEFSATALQHGAVAIIPRNAMTAMQIASVVLFMVSQSRILIRRRQLWISLGVFGVSVAVLLFSFFV